MAVCEPALMAEMVALPGRDEIGRDDVGLVLFSIISCRHSVHSNNKCVLYCYNKDAHKKLHVSMYVCMYTRTCVLRLKRIIEYSV